MKILVFIPLLILFAVSDSAGQCEDCIEVEIQRTITSSSDDAEESMSGNLYLTSSDIELVSDNGNNQTIGLRFTDIPLTSDTEIVEAYLQFTADEETSTDFTSLQIAIEQVDHSQTFINQTNNISDRATSPSPINWIVDSWIYPYESDEKHRTPDLHNLILEVINRPNWIEGNAISFIITGTGKRSAISYDFDPLRSAKLIFKIKTPKPTFLYEDIFINEISPSNSKVKDDFQESDDWLEIYNGSEDNLLLSGLYLTDDIDSLTKWQIGSSPLIYPAEFALIWADSDTDQGGLHASFNLSKDGEFLALVQELNGELHILDSLTFPKVERDVSFGRLIDGGSDWVFFGETSPKASNNDNAQYLDAEIIFSQDGGFYADQIVLEMSSTTDADIYYTVNGQSPTEDDLRYDSPLVIESTVSIKAVALKDGFVSKKITSEFYIIDEPSEIAIFNLEMDPQNLWSDEDGIYVKGTNGIQLWCDDESNNWNQDWERPCHLTMYDLDGSEAFSVNAGVKIGGACSRNLKMKSLNIFLRNNTYGDEAVDYKLFPQQDITNYKRFKLRNGGTDWIEMLFRDAMNSVILDNTMDIDLMAYRPVRLYINGNYWGVHGAREMINKYYIESHHGVHHDSIDLLSDPYGNGNFVREGDFERYDEMMNYVEINWLANPTVFQQMYNYIDMEEYINYHISQIYLANYDWPANNVRIWRDRNNGKFRWVLFDTDASTGFQNWGEDACNYDHNTIAHALNAQDIGFVWPNPPKSTYLFRKMMENDHFKNEFVQRTCTYRKTIFNSQSIISKVDSIKSLLQPEMDRHISAWLDKEELGSGDPSGGSVNQWEEHVSQYTNFFEERGSRLNEFYRTTLGLDDLYSLVINIDESTKGTVALHENEVRLPYEFENEYFKNVPIRILAIPDDGYYFSHWLETGDSNADILFTSTENATLTPIFTDQPVNSQQFEYSDKIKIFPNPATDIILVSCDECASIRSITIYDAFGRVIHEQIVSGKKHQVDISKLNSGIYYSTIITDKTRFINKFIVK